jgi:RHS repeat-associated protein
MNTRQSAIVLLFVLLVWAGNAHAVPAAYYSDSLTGLSLEHWNQNGLIMGSSNGLIAVTGSGGSLISNIPTPDGTSDYEVQTTLRMTVTGGTLVHYLRATLDSVSGSESIGEFFYVELQDMTLTPEGGQAVLAVYKRVDGIVSLLASGIVPCHDGMVLRSIVRGNFLQVFVDGMMIHNLECTIPEGAPGIGLFNAPDGNSISSVSLYPLDRVAPQMPQAEQIGMAAFASRVDLQWPAAKDDSTGTGVFTYLVYRDNIFLGSTPDTYFQDMTVSPEANYQYRIHALDYHRNLSSPASVQVTVPSIDGSGGKHGLIGGKNGIPGQVIRQLQTLSDGGIDPRRVGLRSLGSYWGAAGGQIDMLSGNLNFTFPCFTAKGRNGASVSFNLNYNSQLWRKDSGGTWELGRDVGYGYGWKILAGSISPVWLNAAIHHYIFTDSSGAEYWLDTNTSNKWTSKEGIYLTYDANTQRLYFTDGSFWYFGCTSGGLETDAGTSYPTLMQDSNGNQFKISYATGKNCAQANSSARITSLEDVRGSVYQFLYNADAIPHLYTVNGLVYGAETYSFTYASQNINSPFSPSISYGTATLLQSFKQSFGTYYVGNFIYPLLYGPSFEYSSTGSAELIKVNLPTGGYLRWDYQDMTYAGSRTIREAVHHYVAADSTSEMAYTISHNPADTANPVHSWTTVDMPNGNGQKAWFFNPGVTFGVAGLNTAFEQRAAPSQTPAMRRQEFTWTQNSSGNPYISISDSILEVGTANQKIIRVDQALDAYGNVTQSRQYDFDNVTVPVKTYVSTYVTDENYISKNIFNRLLTNDVSDGTQTIRLATNTYDSQPLTNRTGLTYHDTANYGTGMIYRGNLTKQVSPGSTVNIQYDIAGNTVKTDDNNGHSVSTAMDSTKNYAVPSQITPNTEANLASRYSFNNALDPSSSTMPNNLSVSTLYDSYGRISSQSLPSGDVQNYNYFIGYPQPPLRRSVSGTSRSITTSMDGLGRVIKEENSATNLPTVTVSKVYDSCGCTPLGKVKKVSQPYSSGGTVYWTEYTYDALGRTTQISLPNGSGITTYEYTGNITKITDPAGKWKKYITNVFGNLKQVIEPNPSGGADHLTDYTYDLLNRLATVTMTRDGITQVRRYEYDSTTQRLWKITHPESGTVTLAYNSDGSLLSKTNASGRKLQYAYDTYQRVTQIKHFEANGQEIPCQRLTLSYDTNPINASYSQNAWGRATVAQYGVAGCAGSSTSTSPLLAMYSYNAAGNVTGKSLRVPLSNSYTDLPYTFTYTGSFDGRGRLSGYTPPVGEYQFQGINDAAFKYSYDSLDRPIGMKDIYNYRVYIKDVMYGPTGELLQMRSRMKSASGTNDYVKSNWVYNPLVQQTQWSGYEEVGGDSNLIVSDIYYYSATQNNGQLTGEGGNKTYQYDALGRLSSENSTLFGTTLYGYNGFGNRLSLVSPSGSKYLSYNANNQITTANYGYDADGNLTTMPSLTMAYNPAGKLITANGSFGSENYLYDETGRRVYKNVSNNTKWVYFYGPQGQLLTTYQIVLDANIYPFAKYLYFGGKLFRINYRQWTGNDMVQNIYVNRLGSVEKTTGDTVSDNDIGTFDYATYRLDKNTGLEYAWNRYYSGLQGRFTSPDPYEGSANPGNPQSWNRYAYVNNDPINQNDPSGLETRCMNVAGGENGGPVCYNYISYDMQMGLDRYTANVAGKYTSQLSQGTNVSVVIGNQTSTWIHSIDWNAIINNPQNLGLNGYSIFLGANIAAGAGMVGSLSTGIVLYTNPLDVGPYISLQTGLGVEGGVAGNVGYQKGNRLNFESTNRNINVGAAGGNVSIIRDTRSNEYEGLTLGGGPGIPASTSITEGPATSVTFGDIRQQARNIYNTIYSGIVRIYTGGRI